MSLSPLASTVIKPSSSFPTDLAGGGVAGTDKRIGL
jgi:hypothetical protein